MNVLETGFKLFDFFFLWRYVTNFLFFHSFFFFFVSFVFERNIDHLVDVIDTISIDKVRYILISI